MEGGSLGLSQRTHISSYFPELVSGVLEDELGDGVSGLEWSLRPASAGDRDKASCAPFLGSTTSVESIAEEVSSKIGEKALGIVAQRRSSEVIQEIVDSKKKIVSANKAARRQCALSAAARRTRTLSGTFANSIADVPSDMSLIDIEKMHLQRQMRTLFDEELKVAQGDMRDEFAELLDNTREQRKSSQLLVNRFERDMRDIAYGSQPRQERTHFQRMAILRKEEEMAEGATKLREMYRDHLLKIQAAMQSRIQAKRKQRANWAGNGGGTWEEVEAQRREELQSAIEAFWTKIYQNHRDSQEVLTALLKPVKGKFMSTSLKERRARLRSLKAAVAGAQRRRSALTEQVERAKGTEQMFQSEQQLNDELEPQVIAFVNQSRERASAEG